MGAGASVQEGDVDVNQQANPSDVNDIKESGEIDGIDISETEPKMAVASPGLLKGKGKTSKAKKCSHVLTENEMTVVMRFFTMALKDEKILAEIKEKIPRSFYKINLEAEHNLFEKGFQLEGLYFVNEGKIKLVSSSDPSICISEILQGQFYGDVEVLFRQPAALSAVTSAKTSLLLLPVRRLKSHMTKFDTKLEDWCVAANHLPLYGVIDYEVWRQKFIARTLSQVPLFDGWSATSLLALSAHLPQYPITLFPPNSIVMRKGDPGNRMQILVKGRLSVCTDDSEFTSITAFSLPFSLGEEGLCLQKDGALTVVASDPCWIMRMDIEWILPAIKQDAQLQSLWNDLVEKWKAISDVRDEGITRKYSAFIQVELVYKWLRESGNFNLCPPKCVYNIAQIVETKVYTDDMFKDDDSLALLLTFEPHRNSAENVYRLKSTVFVSSRRPMSVPEEDRTGMLVLGFDIEKVTQIVQKYPGAKLTLH